MSNLNFQPASPVFHLLIRIACLLAEPGQERTLAGQGTAQITCLVRVPQCLSTPPACIQRGSFSSRFGGTPGVPDCCIPYGSRLHTADLAISSLLVQVRLSLHPSLPSMSSSSQFRQPGTAASTALIQHSINPVRPACESRLPVLAGGSQACAICCSSCQLRQSGSLSHHPLVAPTVVT